MTKKIQNGIIIVKKGVYKSIPLPEHGEVLIKIKDGVPVIIDKIRESKRFEDLK